MNQVKQIFLGLSAAVLCSVVLSSTAYAGLAGRVQFVSGNVQIVNASGSGRNIQKGDAVNEGDSLVSAAGASAQIKMQDGGMVALRPDTHLKFDQFVFNGKQDGSEKSFFSLLRGGFRAITGLVGQTNKQNYRINTPVATVGIRGTDHETVLILPNTPMALLAPSGAYSKVNVGETTLTTNLGTINVTPNQMGFAGALNQAPQVQAINTKLFTVAAAPVSKAKDEKKAPTQSDKVASTETTAAASTEPTAEVRSVAVVDTVAPNAAVMVSSNASASVEKATTRFAAALTTPAISKVDDVKKLTDASGKKINLTNQTITSSDGSVVAITTVTAASTSTTTVAPTTSTSTAVTTSTSTAATSTTTVAPTTSTSTAATSTTTVAPTTSTSTAATSTTTVAPTTSTSTAVTTSTTTASTPTTTLVVQAYLQSDISYEVSAGQNGGYGNHGMGPSTALTPLSNPTTFQSGQSCSDCGSYSFQLNGASGPVNGQATSFATTGIEFGRWTSVTSVTNTSTYPFGSGSSYSGGRSAWAFGPQGYLDSLITLSSATGGTSTGVFNYVLTGSAPAPSDQNGTAGTLNSLSLAANFSTQTVTAALSASLGSTTWNATSNAMSIGSYNGTGFNGSLTVTGGSAAVAYSGSLNGAFTGQNYAGAVVGYAIQETSSTAGSPTSFSGVAALTRNGVSGNAIVNNGVAAPTGQFVVAQGGGYAGYVQTSSSTTVTGGVLTGFDYSYNTTAGANTNNTSITCTTCTGQAVPDTTTGIQMGSWDTGTRTDVFTSPVTGQFHWIKGPGLNPIYLPEVLLGSMNYTLDGGSAPTNQTGVTGSLNSASLTVNFTTQTVDLTLGVTANGHTWTASSTGLPLDWTNYSKNGFSTNYYGNAASNALTVTLDGAPVTTGYSSLSGQLTGSGLNGALFQYELNASQWLPNVPGNLVASDGVAVQAPSVTVTNSTAGGSANVTFPVGTSGTVVVQPATTLTLGLNAAGAPTSASLAGGVSATVTTLIADTTKPGSYNGLASTGESVAIDTYAATSAARYSNFGEWRILPTVTSVGTGPFSNGAFAGGMLLTPSASMPTSNVVVTGTYTGLMVGSAQDSVNNTPFSLTAGEVVLSANFSTGALTGTISNILAFNRVTGVLAGYFNDLDLTATIGANAFTGSVTAQAGPGTSTCGTFCPPPTVGGAIPSPVNLPVGATGSSGGHFYGPNANELTGVWQLTNGTIQAAGAFGANNGTSFIGISESVNGTVALVATTPADTATVYRVVAFSAFDPSMVSDSLGGLRTDGSYNSNAHVSADTAGNLTGFDAWLDVSSGSNSTSSMKQAVALGKGTSVAADLGTDAVTGISWGRWAGGNIAMTDRATGVSSTASNASSLHWLAGPSMTAPVALPTTGIYNYTLAGGTAPTDNLGNTGTLNSALLTANFTTQTVNIGVNVGITNATGAANYVASANNVAIEQRSGFSAKTGVAAGSPSALTATCNGAGCGPVSAVQARIGGAFTGSTGQGAGMIYGFANGSNVVSGVAAFKR